MNRSYATIACVGIRTLAKYTSTPESWPTSRNRVNERNAHVYRPTAFIPSQLVFSCCSACFFFVQRFSIQYHSVFTKYYCECACDTCERHDVPHERTVSRRAYSRTYVMNQVRWERRSLTHPATLIMRVCIWWRNTSDTRSGAANVSSKTMSLFNKYTCCKFYRHKNVALFLYN